jgi:phage tail-like protein
MPTNPVYGDFNFLVNWGGNNPRMSRISPLIWSTDILEYRDGGDKLTAPQKAPGITRYEPIVLERRIHPGDMDFSLWADQIKTGSYTNALRDITISLLDAQMNPVIVIKVTNCWPSAYEISGLDGDISALVVERLTLEYQSWERQDTATLTT